MSCNSTVSKYGFFIIIVCVLLYSSFILAGEPWIIAFGGPKPDNAYSVKQTQDGGYIIAGSTQSFGAGGMDIWVLKLDSAKKLEWQKTYGQKKSDEAYAIQQTHDGGYVVAGVTKSSGVGHSDIWVLRLNSFGNLIWQNTYGTKNTEIGEGDRSIHETDDGGFILAGTIIYDASKDLNKLSHSDIWVLKLNASGAIVWQNAYGASLMNVARSIEPTRDKGYILAGYAVSFSFFKGGNRDFLVLKLDSSGKIRWEKTYGGKDADEAYSIQQAQDGGYIVAGGTKSFGTGNYDYWVLKLDSSGEVSWQKAYGGKEIDIARNIIQTHDGGYLVSGTTNSFGAGQDDFLLLKLDSSGKVLWQKVYGEKDSEGIFSAAQTNDEGYILAGYTDSFGAGKTDALLLKLEEYGATGATSKYFAQGYALVSESDAKISNTIAKVTPLEFITKDTGVVPVNSSSAISSP